MGRRDRFEQTERKSMREINFVDVTYRDAHQSLWGERMDTAMMFKVAPIVNQVGYKAVDVSGPAHFVFAVRYLRENPWERLRLLSEAIPNAPLSIIMMGTSLTPFGFTSPAILTLWMERLAKNGVRRIQIFEPSNNMKAILRSVRSAKNAGLETVVGLLYSHSPFHTDEYYARKARDIVGLSPDAIYIKDPAGLLTPERTQSLIPVVQKNIDGLPLELHSHCTTGLAPLCYLQAMQLEIRTFHTAISSLANGPSLPSIENVLKNARRLGYSANINEEALNVIAAHFREVAKIQGFPTGEPVEYDISQYEHQIPGGVITNLRRHLAEIKTESRFWEVLEEIVLVRKELGYPIMVTPFSQFVVTQATLNIIEGERYKTVTDEVIKFALGYYGEQVAPIDQNVMDKIHSLPRTKELMDWTPPQSSIEDFRREIGSHYSDDELLLIILTSEEDYKTMQAAGPIKTEYRNTQGPLMVLIEELMKLKNLHHISIEKENFSLALTKGRKSNKRP